MSKRNSMYSLYAKKQTLWITKRQKVFIRIIVLCPLGRNRTCDRLLKRELLYQLSYERLFQDFTKKFSANIAFAIF